MPNIVPIQGAGTVATSSALALERVPYGFLRISWALKNTSAGATQGTHSLGDGVPAIAGSGLVLDPADEKGESAPTLEDARATVSQNPIYIIGTVANGTYAFYEKLVPDPQVG